VIIGFLLFGLTGFVFGYAAPKAWSFLPILLPICVGAYTGFMDTWDAELVVLILVGAGITIGGILLGRMLLYSVEGRGGGREAAT
jgi:hypothetical protein